MYCTTHVGYIFHVIPLALLVYAQIAQNRSMRPRNVHVTLTKMAIANQTQFTPLCFGYDRAALSAPSLVGELSVTLRELPHTFFGGLRAPWVPYCRF